MAIFSFRRVALGFVVVGVTLYADSQYWLATRILAPLDIPISLSRGHIRTPEFRTNLDAVYYVSIEIQTTSAIPNLECLMWGCDQTPAIFSVKWTLTGDEQAEWRSNDYMSGSFHETGSAERHLGWLMLSGGRHTLDIDVLSDTSVLNKGNPRLKVETYWDGRSGLSRYEPPAASVVLVVIGGIVLLLSRSKHKAEHPADLSIFAPPGAGQQGAGYLRRFPRRVLFAGLPSFALIMASVLLLVFFPVWNPFFAALDWQAPGGGEYPDSPAWPRDSAISSGWSVGPLR